jgi:hypothetical protein
VGQRTAGVTHAETLSGGRGRADCGVTDAGSVAGREKRAAHVVCDESLGHELEFSGGGAWVGGLTPARSDGAS